MAELKKIVRIAGTDLLGDRKIGIALNLIKGVDFMFSNALLKVMNINPRSRVGELSNDDIKKLEDMMRNPIKYGIPAFLVNRRRDRESGKDMHVVSSDVELKRDLDIREMKKIKCYRGVRHTLGLRVRGQRTKSTGRGSGIIGVKRRKLK